MQRSLLALGILTILIFLTTWIVTTTTIRRPLRGLLAATRRVANGDSEVRLTSLYSAGEFGQLAQSFDHMTEALQARQHALAESEARFRSLFENAPYGIFTSDPDGRFLEVNPEFAKILGCDSAAELAGKETWPFYETRKQLEDLIQRLRSQEHVRGIEVRLRRRDGKAILARGAGRLVRDRQGDIVAHEVIVEDITEQRDLEEQFHQAQKLEAIGRLAGGVAHDFNNLLTVILGFTDLMREELPQPLHEDLDEIRKAGLSAKVLTQQLLAFSRRQVLEVEPVNLTDVLQDTEKMLRRLIGEDIQLISSFEPHLGTVKADRRQVEQVVLNLAVNARDAMPRGGKLILETRNEVLTAPLRREGATMPAGRYVTTSVRDTGVGMDAETRGRIFEPFFTTKERGKGTGLGLSTVYGIIKQSGGFIWVDSQPGEGTTFRIYLPRIDEPAAGSRPPESYSMLTGSGETLLVVEDDDGVRAVTHRILTSNGYNVLQAKTAEEAVELARGVEGDVALLVTDVVLPGMSGPELAELIVAERPSTKSFTRPATCRRPRVNSCPLERMPASSVSPSRRRHYYGESAIRWRRKRDAPCTKRVRPLRGGRFGRMLTRWMGLLWGGAAVTLRFRELSELEPGCGRPGVWKQGMS